MYKRQNIYFENNILHDNNAIQKYSKIMYKEAILIHLHTRSINNLVIKSLKTRLPGKYIQNISGLKTVIDNLDKTNIINTFIDIIGIKASLPYAHSQTMKVHLINYKIIKYDNSIINLEEENKILNMILTENNISIIKYNKYINILNLMLLKEYRFHYTLDCSCSNYIKIQKSLLNS